MQSLPTMLLRKTRAGDIPVVNKALREHGAVGEDGVVCKRVERNNLEKHSAAWTEKVQKEPRAETTKIRTQRKSARTATRAR